MGIASDYDFHVPKHSTTSPSSSSPMNRGLRDPQGSRSNYNNYSDDGGLDAEEALMDLAQLAELHQEAERMKALGNKHMAAQVRHCYCYCYCCCHSGISVWIRIIHRGMYLTISIATT
jgi:hypothetical protein